MRDQQQSKCIFPFSQVKDELLQFNSNCKSGVLYEYCCILKHYSKKVPFQRLLPNLYFQIITNQTIVDFLICISLLLMNQTMDAMDTFITDCIGDYGFNGVGDYGYIGLDYRYRYFLF